MTYDDWKATDPRSEDWAERPPGCECDQEEGDSACPVHGSNDEEFEEDDLNDGPDFEVIQP